ncbi:DMT family transporter [Pseudoroseicyclus sp. CXY001]|uniref:DMT family transporter n=1 Tax=Pseudoroseicyclus sp. CXY001 TaxID=3242492 RepID=UPI0035714E5E
MGSNLKGVLLALAAFGIYATHDTVVKFLGGGYSAVQLIFFSTLLSFPLATFTLISDKAPGTLRPAHPGWVAARTIAALIGALCNFYAFSTLPLAQVYVILFASPLIITVLSIPVLGEKVGIRRWTAVVVGLAGVVVAIAPSGADGFGLTWGHAAALVGAFAGSFTAISVRKIGPDERPVVLMLYPMILNFLVMGAALAFVYEPMPVSHLGLLAAMACLGFLGGLVIIAAYKAGEAAVVAPMQYSQILWAVAYGYLVFGEAPGRNTMIGAVVIIASGLFILGRESRKAESEQPVTQTRMSRDVGTAPRPSVLMRMIDGRRQGRGAAVAQRSD